MTIWGADTGDYFNDLPLLATGDVNGDGKDDLLIGARFGDGAGNARDDGGEAYLIYGRDPLPKTVDIAEGEPDVTFFGAEPGDQLGYAGTLADVNEDGLSDVIIDAPFARSGVGAVYVFYGGRLAESVVDLADADPDVSFVGPHSSSFFGDSVSSADVNGDLANDVLVGAVFARRPADRENPSATAGAVYVFYGGSDDLRSRNTADDDYDAVIYGENADPHPDELGDNVWGADVSGDGIGDIIMTAEAADAPGNERSVAAEVHILFGSTNLGGVYDIAANDQDVSIYGADQNDTLGFQLSAGDVNDDGVADVLASARGADGPDNAGQENGEVHIILGGDLPEAVDLIEGQSDAYLYGNGNADMLGYAIHVLDLNGDGRNELMVGSGFAEVSSERRDAGAVYILDASALTGAVRVGDSPFLLVISGAQESDAFGTAATSGDLDGDGSPEIIVLALRGDGPNDSRVDAGEIYVIKP